MSNWIRSFNKKSNFKKLIKNFLGKKTIKQRNNLENSNKIME